MLFRAPQCPESNLALTRNAEGWDDFVGESVAWRETDVAKAEAVVGEIKGTGGQARAYAADLRQGAEIDRLVTSFVSDVGRIDILVNCAGVYFPTTLGETTEEAFDLMVSSHLKNTFFMVHRVAPLMKQARYGKIVNVSSAAAFKSV